jgi:hypothetical protein
MRISPFLPFLSLALAAAAAPARAATIATSSFSLAVPAEWADSPFIDDSAATIGDTAGTSCDLFTQIADRPVTAQEIDSLRGEYTIPGDSLAKLSEGPRTLGGRPFTFVEYRDTDTSLGDSRVRFYFAFEGGLLFTAALEYANDPGSNAVTLLESALATLKLGSAAPVRAWTGLASRPLPPAAARDVLGRALPMRSCAAFFRLPAR